MILWLGPLDFKNKSLCANNDDDPSDEEDTDSSIEDKINDFTLMAKENYDNQSCIKLSENPVFHDRSKHIEICYHFIRDNV